MLVGGNDWPLPRLQGLAFKVGAGVRRNVVRPADGRTSRGAVLEDDQARAAVGVKHGRLDESALRDLVSERREAVGGVLKGGGAGVVRSHPFQKFLARVLLADVDGVTTVVVGAELARVDFYDGKVQGVLTGFGG